ncbi:MAG: efflux transporter outer membrane subunit [Candidatus Electrothrix aestuarii]|uniref:Efflux transporter outer membrane subunit n=1 Tax=Candidatus Electrothrix aestuarii TaxID=3062594 RepID=A0AAU8LZA2_9BACT|nr:efflux transporter outer membrane subunit [Candidatus Electrothrix aestuarii]
MRTIQMLALATLLLSSGCTLAPQYIRPKDPVPAEWPAGDAYKGLQKDAIKKVAGIPWQEFITDAKLRKVIAAALKNNRDLRVAILNVERAQAMYGIQRSSLWPSVDGTAGMAKERRSVDLISADSSRTIEQYSLNLGMAAWEIDFFGRVRSLADQALEDYLATEEARRSAELALISQVAKAYLTLAADQENLKLARATLESQQDSYDLVDKSYANGLATELDLRRAQTEVEAAKRDVPRFAQMVAQDRNALNLLVGAPVSEKLLPTKLSSVAELKEVDPGLPSAVLLNRPDIAAAEHKLKGAYAYVGAARASVFPRITLTASAGTASDELSGLFGSGTGIWSFVPQLQLPIFDPRVWKALQVSKVDREILLTQYEKTVQTAFKEVADALAVQGTISEQVAAQESLVESAEATYELSDKRYTMGLDSYLSVLDAHRSLYAQQQALISLRLARLANQVTLYTVLGGGQESKKN